MVAIKFCEPNSLIEGQNKYNMTLSDLSLACLDKMEVFLKIYSLQQLPYETLINVIRIKSNKFSKGKVK